MAKEQKDTGQQITALLKRYVKLEKQHLKAEEAKRKAALNKKLKYREQRQRLIKEVIKPVMKRLCKMASDQKMRVDSGAYNDQEQYVSETTVHARAMFPHLYFTVEADYTKPHIEVLISPVFSELPEDLKKKKPPDTLHKVKPDDLTKEALEAFFLDGLTQTFSEVPPE